MASRQKFTSSDIGTFAIITGVPQTVKSEEEFLDFHSSQIDRVNIEKFCYTYKGYHMNSTLTFLFNPQKKSAEKDQVDNSPDKEGRLVTGPENVTGPEAGPSAQAPTVDGAPATPPEKQVPNNSQVDSKKVLEPGNHLKTLSMPAGKSLATSSLPDSEKTPKNIAINKLKSFFAPTKHQRCILFLTGKSCKDGNLLLDKEPEGEKNEILTFQDVLEQWETSFRNSTPRSSEGQNKTANKPRTLLIIVDVENAGAWAEELKAKEEAASEKDMEFYGSISVQASCKNGQKPTKGEYGSVFLNNMFHINGFVDLAYLNDYFNRKENKENHTPVFVSSNPDLSEDFGLRVGFNSWEELERWRPFRPQGHFVSEMGDFLSGTLKSVQLHGPGEKKTWHGLHLKGHFANDKLDGVGRVEWGGLQVHGSFVKGRLEQVFSAKLTSGAQISIESQKKDGPLLPPKAEDLAKDAGDAPDPAPVSAPADPVPSPADPGARALGGSVPRPGHWVAIDDDFITESTLMNETEQCPWTFEWVLTRYPNGSVRREMRRNGVPHGNSFFEDMDGHLLHRVFREGVLVSSYSVSKTGRVEYSVLPVANELDAPKSIEEAEERQKKPSLSRQKVQGGVTFVGQLPPLFPRFSAEQWAECLDRKGWIGDQKYTVNVDWEGKVPHGQGEISDEHQKTFTGEFVSGVFEGTGSYKNWRNQSSYEGSWKGGLRWGHGEAVFPDGSRYTGEWKADMIWGEGTFVTPLQEVYKGFMFVPRFGPFLNRPLETFTANTSHFRFIRFAQSRLEIFGLCTVQSLKIGFAADKILEKSLNESAPGHRSGQIKSMSQKRANLKSLDDAIYFGEVQRSRLHGYGRQTTSDQCIFESEFVNDMLWQNTDSFRRESPIQGNENRKIQTKISSTSLMEKFQIPLFGETEKMKRNWQVVKAHGPGKYNYFFNDKLLLEADVQYRFGQIEGPAKLILHSYETNNQNVTKKSEYLIVEGYMYKDRLFGKITVEKFEGEINTKKQLRQPNESEQKSQKESENHSQDTARPAKIKKSLRLFNDLMLWSTGNSRVFIEVSSLSQIWQYTGEYLAPYMQVKTFLLFPFIETPVTSAIFYFHGKGKLQLEDQFEYEGEFHEGCFQGKGSLKIHDRPLISGDWVQNLLRFSHGKFAFNDYSVYFGECLMNFGFDFSHFNLRKQHEPSSLLFYKVSHEEIKLKTRVIPPRGESESEVDYISRTFNLGSIHGVGIRLNPPTYFYIGEFDNNLFNGLGRFQHSNGFCFEGYFEDGHMSGFGRFTFYNGDIYQGVFCGSCMHGSGAYTTAQGTQYAGNFFLNCLLVNKYKISQTAENGKLIDFQGSCAMIRREEVQEDKENPDQEDSDFSKHWRFGYFHGYGIKETYWPVQDTQKGSITKHPASKRLLYVFEGIFSLGRKIGRGKVVIKGLNLSYVGDFCNNLFGGTGVLSFGDAYFLNGKFLYGKFKNGEIRLPCLGKVLQGYYKNEKFYGDIPVFGEEDKNSPDFIQFANDHIVSLIETLCSRRISLKLLDFFLDEKLGDVKMTELKSDIEAGRIVLAGGWEDPGKTKERAAKKKMMNNFLSSFNYMSENFKKSKPKLTLSQYRYYLSCILFSCVKPKKDETQVTKESKGEQKEEKAAAKKRDPLFRNNFHFFNEFKGLFGDRIENLAKLNLLVEYNQLMKGKLFKLPEQAEVKIENLLPMFTMVGLAIEAQQSGEKIKTSFPQRFTSIDIFKPIPPSQIPKNAPLPAEPSPQTPTNGLKKDQETKEMQPSQTGEVSQNKQEKVSKGAVRGHQVSSFSIFKLPSATVAVQSAAEPVQSPEVPKKDSEQIGLQLIKTEEKVHTEIASSEAREVKLGIPEVGPSGIRTSLILFDNPPAPPANQTDDPVNGQPGSTVPPNMSGGSAEKDKTPDTNRLDLATGTDPSADKLPERRKEKLVFEDSVIFEGSLIDNQPHGLGEVTLANKQKIRGHFIPKEGSPWDFNVTLSSGEVIPVHLRPPNTTVGHKEN